MDFKEKERLRTLRNLNPHAEARLAMFKWGKKYSKQRCGSMDFWNGLDESDKRLCREQLTKINDSPRESIN